jgi:type I restriction enzyme R subunit
MSQALTESTVERAVFSWLEGLGYAIKHGPEIAPGELYAKRKDNDKVILGQRLLDAIARLNPDLPPEVFENAFHKITRPDGPILEARNRAFHKKLVEVAL